MKQYRISNEKSGLVFGVYEGETDDPITIRQGWDSMIDGSDTDSLEQIDEQRTKEEFAKQIREAVAREFPEREIDVEVTDEDPTFGVECNDAAVADRVREICEEAFDTQMFWVNKCTQ